MGPLRFFACVRAPALGSTWSSSSEEQDPECKAGPPDVPIAAVIRATSLSLGFGNDHNKANLREILGERAVKRLGSPSFEDRQAACEAVRRRIQEEPSLAELLLESLIPCLQDGDTNLQKGALFGHAAVASALGSSKGDGLASALLLPVLRKLSDADPRVRYYAVETTFNIASTLSAGALCTMRRSLHDAANALRSDSNAEVRRASALLRKQLAEIGVAR